jgi:hypothetical protein
VAGFAAAIFLPIRWQMFWLIPVGLVVTFILMWLWWSFMITRWRIWAFTNVRNVHELREKAVNRKLIWPDGMWFEKTEIRSAAQKQKLLELKNKFKFKDIPEVVIDDRKIPFETKIYYSKFLHWFNRILPVAVGGFGLYEIIEGEPYGYFMAILAVAYAVFVIPKLSNTEPQIILNEKGVKLIHIAFVSWDNVKKISVKLRGYGNSAKWYLDVDFKKQDSAGNRGGQVDITDLEKSPNKIEELVKLYRQRYREQN